MPEIAEVARIVHFLRLHLVGRKIASASAIDDSNVFGKAGTTGEAVKAALEGKQVVSAGNQGKYFWITFDKPPHLVMHFGMTGWVHIKGQQTAYTNYYKRMKPDELEQWPPKFWKFQIKTEGKPEVEVAFTDARRFGRVRLLDCPGADIRNHTPLKENGPDPVIDACRFTEEYLRGRMRARHVPVKALLLDQAMISGIGNWVADETLYQAALHPEQYSDSFSDAEIKRLYECIKYVCQTAVDRLGDSDQFPEHWLFNHRWGKGGKGSSSKLPNGEKLAFITVGGRTSCYAPRVQRKTGQVVPEAKAEPIKDESDVEALSAKKPRKHKLEMNGVESRELPTKRKKPSIKKMGKDPTKPKLDSLPGRRRSTRLQN
ncbi:formamidopyrimidine-DNA glycosylase [Metarhizium album ARSEF 1941]|uniref:Formamidopyrimidine-DNA glycosylase n=1 Tax=Metarhizium album (strain ARSEF 1941) TaxID=1081103 RepID=A0A0B2X7J0_METAS|nr:formamidopyrimidine-DNA glycosylase [Metarhizium album ARSEF 1941]KHO01718.1 formamidopyrimidine-DNA glycosylase [Metarhizium album ARSEF 1941]